MEGHTRKYDTQYIGVLSNSGVTVLTRLNCVDLTLKHPKSVPPTIMTYSFRNFNAEAFCIDISETP